MSETFGDGRITVTRFTGPRTEDERTLYMIGGSGHILSTPLTLCELNDLGDAIDAALASDFASRVS